MRAFFLAQALVPPPLALSIFCAILELVQNVVHIHQLFAYLPISATTAAQPTHLRGEPE
jgi:hypothetical protein